MTIRRVLLWALNLLGVFVGVWALFLPTEFYSSFPGLGMHWISIDGAFNEHLIRDVGALYLALVGAGVVAALSRSVTTSRAVAVAWIVFSLPHLLYHLEHLHGLAPLDAVAEPVSLSVSLILGLALLAPAPKKRAGTTQNSTTTTEEAHA